MATSFTMIGADRVASTLHLAARAVADLTDAHRAAAAIFTPVARAQAPKLTGALAGATRPEATKYGAGVSNPLPYFGPIHYGWGKRNIAAQPFVDDAVVATQGQWVPVYEHAIAQACALVKGA
jgi:hypothetical protein